MSIFKLESKMTFGQYKGWEVHEVIRYHYSYARWASNNVKFFNLDSKAEETLENTIKQKRKNRLSGSYPQNEARSASNQTYLDIFGHTGPDGGWGNGI